MSDVVRWEHPRDAAAEAVLWATVEDIAKTRKEEARAFAAEALVRESSRGYEALINGTLIGSVTRSAASKKRDITDPTAFLAWAVEHRTDLLTVEYRTKEAFLRTLRDVEGTLIDHIGEPVPGVGVRESSGSVRVNRDIPAAKAVLAELVSSGRLSMDGLKALEQAPVFAVTTTPPATWAAGNESPGNPAGPEQSEQEFIEAYLDGIPDEQEGGE